MGCMSQEGGKKGKLEDRNLRVIGTRTWEKNEGTSFQYQKDPNIEQGKEENSHSLERKHKVVGKRKGPYTANVQNWEGLGKLLEQTQGCGSGKRKG